MSFLWPPARRRARLNRERERRAQMEYVFQERLSDYVNDFKYAIEVIDSKARALTEESLKTTDAGQRQDIDNELAKLADQKWRLETAATRLRRQPPEAGELQQQVAAISRYATADKTRHDQRVDLLILSVAFLLVAALFLVIFVGIFRHMTGEAVAQAATPIAGLAGIAVGYLFSDRSNPK
jgi:hypothetical protein